MRLGENTQMGTFGKRPCLLDRLRSSGEPLPPLVAPAQEIALLGDAPLLAHPLEQAIELRPFRQPFRLKRKDAGERLVEEHERPVRAELRDSGGQPIQRVALRAQKAQQLGAGLLQILHVECKARHPRSRSEEHTSELQSLMLISYSFF